MVNEDIKGVTVYNKRININDVIITHLLILQIDNAPIHIMILFLTDLAISKEH